MEVITYDWNSFLVKLAKESKESREEYLGKALNCLERFGKSHSTINIDHFWGVRNDLENLARGMNFCDLHLEMHCDVKYKVRPNEERNIPSGIWVYSHRMESMRPMVAFLKEKWEEFEFNSIP